MGSVAGAQWNAWGRTAIPHLQGQRVLELAHGPGHLLVAMAERGLSPVGLDLSPAMSRLARRRLLAEGNLAVPPVCARAQDLPFRDGCFESIVATFPTEFILARATLREAARVLGSGGRLVIAAGVRLCQSDPLARLIWWLYRITGQGDPLPSASEATLVEAGFASRIVREAVGHSQVILVVTDKQGPPRI